MPSYETARAAWRPSEAWLRDRNGRLLETVRVDFAVRRLDWVPLARIAPSLREAVIASEDRRFRDHDGVDWRGLAGSAWAGLRGRHPRGASTITMQLAGFLAPELGGPGARGMRDKLRQIRAARAIEAHWSKDQILEAYLNLASFRGETQGIGAASPRLFGKAPDALGRDDALLARRLAPVAAGRCQPGRAPRLPDRPCRRLRGDGGRSGGDDRSQSPPRRRSRSRAAPRLQIAEDAGRDDPDDARHGRPADGARRASAPADGPRRPRARRRGGGGRQSRPATCSPMSAAPAAARPRPMSTMPIPIARPDRR